MLIGAHSVIYSTNPDADRAFLRDVIKLTNVDAGGGYVIFGLPPSEVAVHQHDKNDVHELYLMCADVEAFIEELKSRPAATSEKTPKRVAKRAAQGPTKKSRKAKRKARWR
jgi:hypothetical protein